MCINYKDLCGQHETNELLSLILRLKIIRKSQWILKDEDETRCIYYAETKKRFLRLLYILCYKLILNQLIRVRCDGRIKSLLSRTSLR